MNEHAVEPAASVAVPVPVAAAAAAVVYVSVVVDLAVVVEGHVVDKHAVEPATFTVSWITFPWGRRHLRPPAVIQYLPAC